MKKKNQKIRILSITLVSILAFSVLASPVFADEINPDNIIQLVNDSREKEGISPLAENEKLDKIAQDKLDDMITNKYFAHTSPKGINPWFWFEKENYDYKYAGENLAINFLKVEDEHEAWMNSPTHRKNILNANYREIGVAVGAGTINGQDSIVAVQEFGTRVGAEAELNNSKNFSGKEKTNLIEEGKKIEPAVLSAKDIGEDTPGSGTGNPSVNNLSNGTAYNYLTLFNIILIMLALALAPAVFVIESCKKLWPMFIRKGSVAIKFMDNINEAKLVKIHFI